MLFVGGLIFGEEIIEFSYFELPLRAVMLREPRLICSIKDNKLRVRILR